MLSYLKLCVLCDTRIYISTKIRYTPLQWLFYFLKIITVLNTIVHSSNSEDICLDLYPRSWYLFQFPNIFILLANKLCFVSNMLYTPLEMKKWCFILRHTVVPAGFVLSTISIYILLIFLSWGCIFTTLINIASSKRGRFNVFIYIHKCQI